MNYWRQTTGDVHDDEAMDRIYAESGDSLLQGATGKLFINCATISPATHVEVERRAEKAGKFAVTIPVVSAENSRPILHSLLPT